MTKKMPKITDTEEAIKMILRCSIFFSSWWAGFIFDYDDDDDGGVVNMSESGWN